MKFKTLMATALVATALMAAAYAQRPTVTDVVSAYGDTDFRLGPGDVIDVSVYQEKELSTTVPVRPDGKISIPLVGEITASGKTAIDLQREVAQKYAQYIAQPAVTVVVKEVNSPKVSVLGEVKNPGVYKIKERATVLDAIAMAGGLTEYAKKSKITVIRVDGGGGQKHMKFNLDDQIKGRRSDPFYVLPYDTIYIQ
jgi:polysaccharide export outer membrane protein